jgi:RNA polymerase sigma-70 factor, ECF subfamily
MLAANGSRKSSAGGGQNDVVSPRPVADRLHYGHSFEAIFDVVYEPLQRYVRRRAPVADVDDVVADTLATVWRRLDDVPAGDEIAWTLGVARWTLANWRRGDQRRTRLAARAAIHASDATAPSVEASASGLHADTDLALENALAALSGDERELLRLWAWERMPPRQIAIVMGLTPNAVSIRLHRAKRNLADHLAKHLAAKHLAATPDGSERKTTATPGHEPGRHETHGEEPR